MSLGSWQNKAENEKQQLMPNLSACCNMTHVYLLYAIAKLLEDVSASRQACTYHFRVIFDHRSPAECFLLLMELYRKF